MIGAVGVHLRPTSPPAVEPITLDETKAWLRLEHDQEDDTVLALILGARAFIEAETGRALISQQWTAALDVFPPVIRLPRPPLITVDEIRYTDTAGTEQVLSTTLYRVLGAGGKAPARIVPAFGETWPSVRYELGAIEIDLTAGYGAAPKDVPDDLRQAMRFLVSDAFENRTVAITGTNVTMTQAVANLLREYRMTRAA